MVTIDFFLNLTETEQGRIPFRRTSRSSSKARKDERYRATGWNLCTKYFATFNDRSLLGLLSIGEAAQGKDLAETQMIQNHKAAIEYLVDSASDLSISPFIVRNLHALLSDNLLQNPAACGRLRVIPVGIGGSAYIPLENGQLIQELFDQLTTTADLIQNPFRVAS